MYDELIGRLRANGELFIKYIPNAEGEILLQAADAIEELNKSKWIPVTERLPYKSGYYLIVTHLGLTDDAEDWMKDNAVDVTMAHYADYSNIWTTDSGAAYNADLSKCDKTRCEYVTHWIPLPEPPKEEA